MGGKLRSFVLTDPLELAVNRGTMGFRSSDRSDDDERSCRQNDESGSLRRRAISANCARDAIQRIDDSD